MILTDRDIKLAIEKRLIVIDPQPAANAFSSTALDLTLGPNITVFKEAEVTRFGLIVDPSHSDFESEQTLAQISENQVIDANEGYLLNPNSFVLAWTTEYVNLVSDRTAARVEGKSSLARFGLGVHVTASTIQAGFSGHIRLEMVNHGKVPIRLRAGMRICQLVFEPTSGTPNKSFPLDFLSVSINETF